MFDFVKKKSNIFSISMCWAAKEGAIAPSFYAIGSAGRIYDLTTGFTSDKGGHGVQGQHGKHHHHGHKQGANPGPVFLHRFIPPCSRFCAYKVEWCWDFEPVEL